MDSTRVFLRAKRRSGCVTLGLIIVIVLFFLILSALSHKPTAGDAPPELSNVDSVPTVNAPPPASVVARTEPPSQPSIDESRTISYAKSAHVSAVSMHGGQVTIRIMRDDDCQLQHAVYVDGNLIGWTGTTHTTDFIVPRSHDGQMTLWCGLPLFGMVLARTDTCQCLTSDGDLWQLRYSANKDTHYTAELSLIDNLKDPKNLERLAHESVVYADVNCPACLAPDWFKSDTLPSLVNMPAALRDSFLGPMVQTQMVLRFLVAGLYAWLLLLLKECVTFYREGDADTGMPRLLRSIFYPPLSLVPLYIASWAIKLLADAGIFMLRRQAHVAFQFVLTCGIASVALYIVCRHVIPWGCLEPHKCGRRNARSFLRRCFDFCHNVFTLRDIAAIIGRLFGWIPVEGGWWRIIFVTVLVWLTVVN